MSVATLMSKLRSALARLTGFQVFGSGVSWVPGVALDSVPNEAGVGDERTSAPVAADEAAQTPVCEPEDLDEILERGHRQVLVALGRSRDGWLDVEQVAGRIRAGRMVALHYLEVLEELGLVEDVDGDGFFELTPEGRAYLVRERLVR